MIYDHFNNFQINESISKKSNHIFQDCIQDDTENMIDALRKT